MVSKSSAHEELGVFLNEVGVKNFILTNEVPKLYLVEWKKLYQHHHIQQKLSEPDYWECWSLVHTLTASMRPSNVGSTPFEHIHRYTPDISKYLTFAWFEWIWFYE